MSENITFVTHLRYDHDDRLSNLQTMVNYYSINFPESKFIFVEDDAEHCTKFNKIIWPKGTSFFFIKNDSLYYRTRALNYGIKQATTPIVVSLDTDCIVWDSSIKKCSEALLADATIAWPYNGYFIDTSAEVHQKFIDNKLNYQYLYNSLPNADRLILGSNHGNFSVRCTNTEYQGVGGIVMFNKERFIDIGLYNEKFICWGAEDNELFLRCKTLEHKMYRDTDLNSMCFHLFHKNAVRHNNPFYQSNVKELNLVEKMTKIELQEYIKTWKYFTN